MSSVIRLSDQNEARLNEIIEEMKNDLPEWAKDEITYNDVIKYMYYKIKHQDE